MPCLLSSRRALTLKNPVYVFVCLSKEKVVYMYGLSPRDALIAALPSSIVTVQRFRMEAAVGLADFMYVQNHLGDFFPPTSASE